MGTSSSSRGPGSGVSFDPSWLDDIDVPNADPSPIEEQQQPREQQLLDAGIQQISPPTIAPPARFRGTRINLGEYVKSGSRDSLRRSLGHYSKTGMGGAKNVTTRMRTSAAVGAGLFRSLQTVRDGNNLTLSGLFNKLKADGADTYQFIDAIIENVCPNGGSLDETSFRNSMYSALSEYLAKFPDADMSNLSDDSIWALTSSFLGHEVFSRVQLDIGQAFEKQSVSMAERMVRLKDMREYISSEISAQINSLRLQGANQSTKMLQRILGKAIENTFRVFEVEV